MTISLHLYIASLFTFHFGIVWVRQDRLTIYILFFTFLQFFSTEIWSIILWWKISLTFCVLTYILIFCVYAYVYVWCVCVYTYTCKHMECTHGDQRKFQDTAVFFSWGLWEWNSGCQACVVNLMRQFAFPWIYMKIF